MRSKLSLVMLLSTVMYGQKVNHKLATELLDVAPDTNLDVIVQYRQAPTETNHRNVHAKGGQLKRNLDVIHAAHYTISAKQLESLSQDADVEFISPDRPVYGTGSKVDAYTGNPDYGWRTVGADLATSVFGLDGTGIGIAIIDSGVDDLDDFSSIQKGSRIVYKASMLPNAGTGDDYGHGDHVTGILAGNGSLSATDKSTYLVRGIAPNANIVSLKALDSTGAGTDSSVIAAIQQAIALKSTYNIRVINLSIGRPISVSYQLDPLCLAVQKAWQAGIVVVVAAGNGGRDNSQGTNGYGTITSPCNSPYVITVGAMNTVGTLTSTDDKIASYSSKGPTLIDHIVKPDLVAPGNHIISLYQDKSWLSTNYPGNAVSRSVYTSKNDGEKSDYFLLSGTSMAAPMVSGAAALMLQKEPTLTPDQVKARLMKTATKFAPGYSTVTDPASGVRYTSEYDIFTIGAGYLNIPAALANRDVLNTAAWSPTATYNSISRTVTVGPTGTAATWGSAATWGTAATWGSSATWGTAATWGTSVFVGGTAATWGSGAVWGTAATWGSSTSQAFSFVWGTSAVWGTNVPVAEATVIAIHGDN